ncbi:DUF455 family protein [Alphaproteobacteria bacterium]|nr:DUF455 family protein [Alphaproteobacteria bacterium]
MGWPRRRITHSAPGRIALLHALAHIELNAIDLTLDIASCFTKTQLPVDFYRDWLGFADDEAQHFLMLSDRFSDLGAAYGDLKPPFNITARNAARFSAAFYGPFATRVDLVASPETRPGA